MLVMIRWVEIRCLPVLICEARIALVKVKDEDVDKTCFVTRKGIYGYKVLPFGLCNAPSTFQRLVPLVLAGLTWEVCLIFLDDLIVFSRTFDEHLDRLQLVFNRPKKRKSEAQTVQVFSVSRAGEVPRQHYLGRRHTA